MGLKYYVKDRVHFSAANEYVIKREHTCCPTLQRGEQMWGAPEIFPPGSVPFPCLCNILSNF